MRADETIEFYNQKAPELALQYESAQVTGLHIRLAGLVEAVRAPLPGDKMPVSPKILEIGSGSGRDCAFLNSLGCRVIVSDASEPMMRQALNHHPELAHRALVFDASAPHLPLKSKSLDMAFSIALLMHLERPAIQNCLKEIHRVLKPGSPLLLSVCISRGLSDAPGRRFTLLSPESWQGLLIESGFQIQETSILDDGLGRGEVKWLDLLANRATKEW